MHHRRDGPVRVLPHGAAPGADRRRPLPPRAPGQSGRHRRLPPGHLGHPRPAGTQDRPGLGGPPSAAARSGAAVRGAVHPDVERPDRRRPDRQDPPAWIAKEELRALLATAQRGGQRHDVAHRLHRFNSWCARSGLPELERLAGTIEAWWPEVLGFLQTQVTNAGTEATNRTVKTAPAPPTASATWTINAAGYGLPAPGDHAGPPPAEVLPPQLRRALKVAMHGVRSAVRTDWEAWKRLLQEAGVRDARLHDARHTAATLLLPQGVAPRVRCSCWATRRSR